MKRTLCKTILFTSLAAMLSGCVIINAMLGVVGLATSGPLQYAGAAYSVGEYAYEYAANDKTPDEVIVEKVAWLFGEDEEPIQVAKADVPIPHTTEPDWDEAIRMKANKASLRDKMKSVAPLNQVQLNTPTLTALSLKPVASKIRTSRQAQTTQIVTRSKPTRVKRAAPSATPAPIPVVVAKTIPAPQHTYVPHTPNPVQERMNRMEHAFPMAERLTDHKPAQGIRYSVGNKKTGRTITAINGDWSVRHELMEHPPQDNAVESSVEVPAQSDLQVAS